MKLAKNHSTRLRSSIPLVSIFVGVCLLLLGQATAVSGQTGTQYPVAGLSQLATLAEANGTVRVLVQLDMPFRPEGDLENVESVQAQQIGIDSLQQSVVNQLADTNTAVIATYKYIPYLALELDAAALTALSTLPQVVAIEEDIPVPPTLSSSTAIIGAGQAWSAGYTGAGQTVVILDTGVDTDHAAFTTGGSRIVSEACYSTTNAGYGSTTICPGGVEASIVAGSGMDCTAAVGDENSKAQSDCSHGTHVASIAAGNDGGTVVGVAPEANIIAMQIFSLFNNTYYCGGYSSCMLTFTSDQILALERVYELRSTYNIASVNMSLGGGRYYSACDSDSRKAAIDNLRAAGIATVIASGNNAYRDSLSAPACIPSAISVGATDDADNVASFSNVAPVIDLMAPGVNIYAAVPDGAGTKHGTSMATPHVTGAWALFKQAVPGATVDEALTAFQTGATLVNDNRTGGTVMNLARIDAYDAINSYVTGLTVDVIASENYLLPNETVQLTISAANDNGVAAGQVSLSAMVPEALALDDASLSNDATVADNVITWTTEQTLQPGQSLSRLVTLTVQKSATGEIPVIVTAVSPDVDEPRQVTTVLHITEVVGCGFNDGFESGVLGAAWETAVTHEGRVRVLSERPYSGSYSAVLDDGVPGGAVSEAGLILTADLSGQAQVTLDFSWHDFGDEYDAAYDGVFVRQQPADAWIKAYDFAGSFHDGYQEGQVDLKAVAAANGLALTQHFQIKFGFSDNFPFNTVDAGAGDGYAVDDVRLSCVPSGLSATQQVDNQNPAPGEAINFQIIVANNELITATNSVISFYLAEGLLVNGDVVVSMGTAVSEALGNSPPLVADGLIIGPGEQVIITIPAIVAENLRSGTVLENVVTISSDEFGASPPVTQKIVVNSGSFAVFVPLVIR